mmetsp:Transcript_4447/g.5372  ORF Transcript_4447/g.5372 Transcript_4447/m.5372 type:complete len:90 (-) Transcript_4447:312-581(-)
MPSNAQQTNKIEDGDKSKTGILTNTLSEANAVFAKLACGPHRQTKQSLKSSELQLQSVPTPENSSQTHVKEKRFGRAQDRDMFEKLRTL